MELAEPSFPGEINPHLFSFAQTYVHVNAIVRKKNSQIVMRPSYRQCRASTFEETNWINVGAFALFHLGAVPALFNFSWSAFAVSIFLFWMCTGPGISMGYHRLHTHRSYQVPLGLEYFFAVCGTLTLEGGPIFWVATHRIHHQKVGPTRRPAFAPGRSLVVSHGLASGWAKQAQ